MSYFYFACKTSSRVVCVGLLTVQLFFNPSQKSLWKRKRRKSSSKDIKLFTYNNTMADAAAPAPELKEYPEFPGKSSPRGTLCFRRSSVVVVVVVIQTKQKSRLGFFHHHRFFFWAHVCASSKGSPARVLSRSRSLTFPSLSLSPKQNSQRV